MGKCKWGVCLFLCLVLFATPVLATKTESMAGEIPVETVTAENTSKSAEDTPVFDSVQVHFEFTGIGDGETELTFGLYKNGETKAADTEAVHVRPDTTSFNLEFSVPAYEIGEMFLLKLEKGSAAFGFVEPTLEEVWLQTYLWSQDGAPVYQTAFYLQLNPMWTRSVRLMTGVTAAPAPYFPMKDGNLYVSEHVLLSLHIPFVKTEAYIFLSSETENHTMQFFRDNIFACKDGVGYNLQTPVFCIDGVWFLPLRDIADHFACPYTVSKEPSEFLHTVWRSAYARWQENEEYVNSRVLESRTDYLIWISLKDYTTNLYKGKNQNWEIVKSMPCTIGAPHTPTIEGEFEYIERLERWTYPEYYCGPVMRFHRGYALHSTLIRYDGTMYDDRVGMQLSLGCIRLHPEDIVWLIETAPMYTKIIITP